VPTATSITLRVRNAADLLNWVFAQKFEIRSAKSETSTKSKIQNQGVFNGRFGF
jgi:hypothetical protein